MTIGTLSIRGEEYVVVSRGEFERLRHENALPPLPPPDEEGHRPAVETIIAVMAQSLIRRRLAAGLEQRELARRAGVRAETISRIESGRYRPRRETVMRIESALKTARGKSRRGRT